MRLAANLGVVSQINELPALKREAEFLKDVPSHRLQQALKDLDRVYQNFFAGRGSYPQPRRKRDGDSFPDLKQFRLTKGWLHGPKFGKSKTDFGAIWICRHRKLGGQIKTITIIREGNRCMPRCRLCASWQTRRRPRPTRGSWGSTAG